MEPLVYLQLQIRLEGKEIVDPCFLRQVEVVPGEDLPLMLLAQLADQNLLGYYAETISSPLYEKLSANIVDLEFPRIDSLLDVLKAENIQAEVGHYKTYIFPSIPVREVEVICFSKQDPKVNTFGFNGFAEEVYALERENRIVSACVSTRENNSCGEAWVFTQPGYRHRGFAQKVVQAWAESLMAAGKVPFYSHEIGNVASANLAKKLGLQPVFEEISIRPIP